MGIERSISLSLALNSVKSALNMVTKDPRNSAKTSRRTKYFQSAPFPRSSSERVRANKKMLDAMDTPRNT